MQMENPKIKAAFGYIRTFLKWGLISILVGLIAGAVGTLFHQSVEYATSFRLAHRWVVWLLPLGGLLIVALYKLGGLKNSIGTNVVLDSVRSPKGVPLALAPLIFVSTVITHLLGGSAGREGAALQLGGSIGSQLGRLLHLDEKDSHLIVLAGMSGVFSALFGTPLTATFFALEVVSVGVIYYSGFIPCIVAALVAYGVSILCGAEPLVYSLGAIPAMGVWTILKVVALAVLCAALSILFCLAMHYTERFAGKCFKNDYLRIAVGGLLLVGLSLLFPSGDYNGAGMDVIARALGGQARPEAFALKLLFTAITIGVGFKGGEIVPTFFIGSTFGCVAGAWLGLDAGFAAALGLVATFCGVVNSPIASIILSVELFGAQGLLFFAIACGVSYMLSGYYGLYSSQKIIYSKLKAEFININAQ